MSLQTTIENLLQRVLNLSYLRVVTLVNVDKEHQVLVAMFERVHHLIQIPALLVVLPEQESQL